MKWFSFVIVAFAGMNLLFPSVAFTKPEKPVVIKSISHIKDSEVKETITFTLAASVSPKMFTLRGENPRLVIDFPESIYLGKNVISLTDGVLASTIRIGLHETPVERTRAVVDLSKERSVQYSSDYSEQNNTLTVIITADTTDAQVNVTPVSSDQPGRVGVAAEKMTSSLVPTILEISFDDSSNRGEMVLFHLDAFSPPTVSAIEKNSPRVLCDFMAMKLDPTVPKTIVANGKYIERIRTARHHDPKKVRVVLDLFPDRDYDLQQVFFRNDNLFVLIVNDLTANQAAQSVAQGGEVL